MKLSSVNYEQFVRKHTSGIHERRAMCLQIWCKYHTQINYTVTRKSKGQCIKRTGSLIKAGGEG